jgi:methylated-DNA-[protein]-cysteine S-methyltransferase
MSEERFCLFETAIGVGGIAWTDAGISGIQLPEPDAARVRARLRRQFPRVIESPPSDEIQTAIELMRKLLQGEAVDLASVRLDMERVPPFDRQVYDVARTIPAGETTSYGQIARRLGDVHLAREVGQALAHNPFPIVVPCHRVIATDGKLGGFSARGGQSTKQRLLTIERANVSWQLPLEAPSTRP